MFGTPGLTRWDLEHISETAWQLVFEKGQFQMYDTVLARGEIKKIILKTVRMIPLTFCIPTMLQRSVVQFQCREPWTSGLNSHLGTCINTWHFLNRILLWEFYIYDKCIFPIEHSQQNTLLYIQCWKMKKSFMPKEWGGELKPVSFYLQ